MIPHHQIRKLVFLCGLLLSVEANSAELAGQILDLNGNPVTDAMVTIYPDYPGPTAQTVFSDAQGQFTFPAQPNYRPDSELGVSVRVLGYELVKTSMNDANTNLLNLTVIVKQTPNQVASAPASAWLGENADHDSTSTFILDCIGCHQVPAPEFRNFAGAMADIPGEDRADVVHQGWDAIVKYMNFQSAEEFGRGPDAAPPDAVRAYAVGDGERVVNFLSTWFSDRMDEISGYNWGAPLAVTSKTVISEYEIARPNAVREALLLGEPKQLYIADVASNRIYKVDPDSGYTSVLEVPSETPGGPHSLHKGPDGSLWVAPFITSVVAHMDVETEEWQTWDMETIAGRPTGIHDLSFGADHTLLTDKQGNIWFSDIANNAVGYLDPRNGDIEIYPAPELPDRAGNRASLYGLVMTSDQEHLWFSQLGIGSFGSFNINTREFETRELLDMNTGPRRLSISHDDVLYVPLYASGQLVEYDTKTNTTTGIYDLPDTASAPYATTWDKGRGVVWITTSNADVLYRFDPEDKTFAVLPMPRTGALIRMVDVDPDTGHLITSYGNIVEHIQGPRMALIIDLGDEAYQ